MARLARRPSTGSASSTRSLPSWAFLRGRCRRLMSGPDLSLADVGYLSFYPLMLAALAVVVRRHVREVASSVWLDAAVGSLGAAAVPAVVLSPVLASDLGGLRRWPQW